MKWITNLSNIFRRKEWVVNKHSIHFTSWLPWSDVLHKSIENNLINNKTYSKSDFNYSTSKVASSVVANLLFRCSSFELVVFTCHEHVIGLCTSVDSFLLNQNWMKTILDQYLWGFTESTALSKDFGSACPKEIAEFEEARCNYRAPEKTTSCYIHSMFTEHIWTCHCVC